MLMRTCRETTGQRVRREDGGVSKLMDMQGIEREDLCFVYMNIWKKSGSEGGCNGWVGDAYGWSVEGLSG